MELDYTTYRSAYLPGEAEGAIPNGSRVSKVFSEDGDSTPVGSLGTVIASHRVGERGVEYFYFVIWDHLPDYPVGVSDYKIGRA